MIRAWRTVVWPFRCPVHPPVCRKRRDGRIPEYTALPSLTDRDEVWESPAALVSDPLTQMAMQADGVTSDELLQLLYRVAKARQQMAKSRSTRAGPGAPSV
jgi:hypothetical protein